MQYVKHSNEIQWKYTVCSYVWAGAVLLPFLCDFFFFNSFHLNVTHKSSHFKAHSKRVWHVSYLFCKSEHYAGFSPFFLIFYSNFVLIIFFLSLFLRTTSYLLLPQSCCSLLLSAVAAVDHTYTPSSSHQAFLSHFLKTLMNIQFTLIQIKFSGFVVVDGLSCFFFVHCIELPMECVSCATSRSSYCRVNIRLPVNLCTVC